MAVTLKKLTGDEIPAELRKPGQEALFAVEDMDGEIRYLESDVEAAKLVTQLHLQDQATHQ